MHIANISLKEADAVGRDAIKVDVTGYPTFSVFLIGPIASNKDFATSVDTSHINSGKNLTGHLVSDGRLWGRGVDDHVPMTRFDTDGLSETTGRLDVEIRISSYIQRAEVEKGASIVVVKQ
jgi:hypothetical protein